MLIRTRFPRLAFQRCARNLVRFHNNEATLRPPVIQIEDGTFYRQHPSSIRLFENVNFTLPSFAPDHEEVHWAILGPSATTFLQVLRGEHTCIPPTARTYPYLNTKEIQVKDISLGLPSRAIQYVGFGNGNGPIGGQTAGTYLSARYESRREATDFSVLDYLTGNTELNSLKDEDNQMDKETLNRVIEDLRLKELLDMPVSNLSNGQTRRAKIARALLTKPEVLLLDEPFMGLDPQTLVSLSPLLHRMATANSPRLILALRPQDPIPDWTTHLMVLGENHSIAFQGQKDHVLGQLTDYVNGVKDGRLSEDKNLPCHSLRKIGRSLTSDGVIGLDKPKDGAVADPPMSTVTGKPLVEMEGVRVAYGDKVVLGNWEEKTPEDKRPGLWWTIRRGERWGVFGPNGSGKTTLLSLICSDHPQTYSLPIKLFEKSRLPTPGSPGISIFDIQNRIGHSSPEIHNHFPKHLTLYQTLLNAWSETFLGPAKGVMPKMKTRRKRRIVATLLWFKPELYNKPYTPSEKWWLEDFKWAKEITFGELSFSQQRIALFLRAVIKKRDLIILDEAFSGMDAAVRDKCMRFLHQGLQLPEHILSKSTTTEAEGNLSYVGPLADWQALICISHLPEEVPGSVRDWICLEEPGTGKPARMGKLEGPLADGGDRAWNEIWGLGGKEVESGKEVGIEKEAESEKGDESEKAILNQSPPTSFRRLLNFTLGIN